MRKLSRTDYLRYQLFCLLNIDDYGSDYYYRVWQRLGTIECRLENIKGLRALNPARLPA